MPQYILQLIGALAYFEGFNGLSPGMFCNVLKVSMDFPLSMSCNVLKLTMVCRERSGSVVACFTQDRGTAGSSLTGVTVLWFLSKTHLS